jgi:hypothetical protein
MLLRRVCRTLIDRFVRRWMRYPGDGGLTERQAAYWFA